MCGGVWFTMDYQNVLWTLLLGALVCWAVEWASTGGALWQRLPAEAAIAVGFLLAHWLNTDYGGFGVLLALLSAVMLYSSYYLGGRSIYLMRRLPDGRQTLRRQVWTVPLLWAVCAAALCALVLGLCYGAWYCITPDQCLPTEENVQRVMNAIAASPYSHYYG